MQTTNMSHHKQQHAEMKTFSSNLCKEEQPFCETILPSVVVENMSHSQVKMKTMRSCTMGLLDLTNDASLIAMPLPLPSDPTTIHGDSTLHQCVAICKFDSETNRIQQDRYNSFVWRGANNFCVCGVSWGPTTRHTKKEGKRNEHNIYLLCVLWKHSPQKNKKSSTAFGSKKQEAVPKYKIEILSILPNATSVKCHLVQDLGSSVPDIGFALCESSPPMLWWRPHYFIDDWSEAIIAVKAGRTCFFTCRLTDKNSQIEHEKTDPIAANISSELLFQQMHFILINKITSNKSFSNSLITWPLQVNCNDGPIVGVSEHEAWTLRGAQCVDTVQNNGKKSQTYGQTSSVEPSLKKYNKKVPANKTPLFINSDSSELVSLHLLSQNPINGMCFYAGVLQQRVAFCPTVAMLHNPTQSSSQNIESAATRTLVKYSPKPLNEIYALYQQESLRKKYLRKSQSSLKSSNKADMKQNMDQRSEADMRNNSSAAPKDHSNTHGHIKNEQHSQLIDTHTTSCLNHLLDIKKTNLNLSNQRINANPILHISGLKPQSVTTKSRFKNKCTSVSHLCIFSAPHDNHNKNMLSRNREPFLLCKIAEAPIRGMVSTDICASCIKDQRALIVVGKQTPNDTESRLSLFTISLHENAHSTNGKKNDTKLTCVGFVDKPAYSSLPKGVAFDRKGSKILSLWMDADGKTTSKASNGLFFNPCTASSLINFDGLSVVSTYVPLWSVTGDVHVDEISTVKGHQSACGPINLTQLLDSVRNDVKNSHSHNELVGKEVHVKVTQLLKTRSTQQNINTVPSAKPSSETTIDKISFQRHLLAFEEQVLTSISQLQHTADENTFALQRLLLQMKIECRRPICSKSWSNKQNLSCGANKTENNVYVALKQLKHTVSNRLLILNETIGKQQTSIQHLTSAIFRTNGME